MATEYIVCLQCVRGARVCGAKNSELAVFRGVSRCLAGRHTAHVQRIALQMMSAARIQQCI